MAGFTDEQALRYARQINIPQVGAAGQERLLSSSALVVGAGGLGSPALLYLAAAGVGRIGVADADPVDLTNLQRQIAHGVEDIGRNKARSARDAMLAIDPGLDVVAFEERLTAANALDVLHGFDVVLDCTDNFPTRYLLNDACVLSGTPLVTAAVLRFYGQLTTVVPHDGPCMRCTLPEPPAPGSVPSCAQAGILGPVAGALGCLAAVEAIKVLLGLPDTLKGRLFVLDALAFEPSVMEIARDPGCPVCGERPTITALVDYEPSC
jgi:molybdopterin/thiamine biosynthesis adenylyltransferase